MAVSRAVVNPTGNPDVFTAASMDVSEGYSVLGTRVLGPQQPGVADVSLDGLSTEEALGQLQTQLNAVLQRLRAHGVIA
jgi:hypothetical protein